METLSLIIIDTFQIRSKEGRVDGFSRSNLNDEDKDRDYDDDDIHAAEESLGLLKSLTIARDRLAAAAEKTATSWPAYNTVIIFSVTLAFGLFLWTARHSLSANLTPGAAHESAIERFKTEKSTRLIAVGMMDEVELEVARVARMDQYVTHRVGRGNPPHPVHPPPSTS